MDIKGDDQQQTRNALIEILNGNVDVQTMTYVLIFIFYQLLVYCRNFTIHELMPRFLHVKPKATPEEIEPFKPGILFSKNIVCFLLLLFNLYLVFPSEYYSDIIMGLNGTKAIPNSTEIQNSTAVWWQMSENRTGFDFFPSCKLKKEFFL